MPKVSVIIPTHNRPELLKRAVNSVLSQTYTDLEIVVVDDGLEKRADETVNNFDDSRLKYIQHSEEKGGSVARNTGIKSASGEFIAFLDDDDEWVPYKLATQMAQFESTPHDVGFCFSAVENVYSDRKYVTTVPSGIGDYHELALSYFKSLLTVTLVVKKYVFEELGVFDEQFPSHQEADLMIRVTEKFKGLGINQSLVRVAVGGHNQVGGSLKRRILGREMLLAKHMEEFKKDKKLLADQNFGLGLMYRDNAQFAKARDMFDQAVRNNFSMRYFLHRLSMIFGGRIYKLIRKRKLPPMKIVAFVRTKNSIFVFNECLTKLSLLVDEIIILDNGSTDGTLEACTKFPKIVKIIRQNDAGIFHEGRDRNLMLTEARKRYPDWITMADPDEVFEKNFTRDTLDKYIHSGYDRISFRMCNFWLSMKYCRFDRDWLKYTVTPQRHMWRNLEGIYYQDLVIHAGLQGVGSNGWVSHFRIKHYGYVNKNNVISKINVFRSYDSTHAHKYNSADFNRKETREHIMCYPFIEFNNGFANYLYILVFKLVCDVLLALIMTKRKHFHKLKIFPG